MLNRRELTKWILSSSVVWWPTLRLTLRADSNARHRGTPMPDANDIASTLTAIDSAKDRAEVAAYIRAFGDDWVTLPVGTLASKVHDYSDYVAGVLGLPKRGVWYQELVTTALSTPRCGCPDANPVIGRAVGKGPSLGGDPVEWYVEASASRVAKEDWHKWLTQAWSAWQAVCGVNPRQTATRDSARCIHSMGKGRALGFDGPSGVLAWAQLPPSANFSGQLLNRYDDDEAWTDETGQRGIIAQAVMCHEIGHLLGLDHSADPTHLMAPYYSDKVICPTKGDIARVLPLYGPRGDTPVQPTTPTVPVPPDRPAGGPCVPSVAPPHGKDFPKPMDPPLTVSSENVIKTAR